MTAAAVILGSGCDGFIRVGRDGRRVPRGWGAAAGCSTPSTRSPCGQRPVSPLALAQSGEAEPARALGEDTLQRARRVLGPDHVIVLSTVAALTHALDE